MNGKRKIWNYHTFDSIDVEYIADKLNTTKTVSKVLNSAGFNAANSDQLIDSSHQKLMKY